MDIATYNACVPANAAGIIEQKGLKQKAVAERAGFTSQQLTDMLKGRKLIKPCDVLALADALGVTANDLFAKTGQER